MNLQELIDFLKLYTKDKCLSCRVTNEEIMVSIDEFENDMIPIKLFETLGMNDKIFYVHENLLIITL